MADMNKNPIEFKADDFVLVQEGMRIQDKKFETKATTFMKDAFKRFCKNKSSVIGAIILAILILCAIIVPIVSPHNITQVNSSEKFLAPKLFEPKVKIDPDNIVIGQSANGKGTVEKGFWDGTRKYTHIVYNRETGVPALSDKYSVAAIKRSLTDIYVYPEPELVDVRSPFGEGGAIVIETDSEIANNDVYMISKTMTFDVNGNYTVDIVFSSDTSIDENPEDIGEPVEGEEPAEGEEPVEGETEEEPVEEEPKGKAVLGTYRVYIKTGESEADWIMIRDFSKNYSSISFNISEALAARGLTSVTGQLVFDVKSAVGARQYILVEKVLFGSNENVSNKEALDAASFDDATAMINIADKEDPSYWACSGRKGIHGSSLYYCDYVLDTYMLTYGDADLVTYTKTELDQWIADGWCTYDPKVGPESFVRLSDECPVDSVESQTVLGVTGKLSSITARGWNYRKMGYTEMPKFILGTDVSGFDLFKRAFAGLRTSLILGVCTAAFCFLFGLLWGAISGYFGGNVDLFMERFCEILGGVPWIVVMTLCILHLGNNFFTFFLALCMTGWMGTSATTRTQFYRFKGREYVLASRTLGSSDFRLILKHILPNAMGTIITGSVLMIPRVIFSEATLAYLNLGLQGKQSFGIMMANNQQYLGIYPNLVIFPAIIIALMMISFNLFGNGLRDAFNPSLKGSD